MARKYYFPEKDQIRVNGVRQYFEEDLGYMAELLQLIGYQEAINKMTEDRWQYLRKLRDLYSEARSEFIQKWNKP